MVREFIVLYTGQKQKKAKVWHDGVLKHDGKGTKAMLYDEKGGRLDSIHIKVQDITLGEQLESDRYYIEVESIKDTGAQKKGSPVISSHNAVDDKPLLQSGGFSQARCAGLKRKKTGFMPPRMVKQPRHEDDDSQEGSALRLNNRIYPSQSSQSPDMGLSTYGFKPHPGQEAPARQMVCSSVRSEPFKSDNSLGETVLSMYSKGGGNKDGYEDLNQGSNNSAPFSPVSSLSPWSVCGAQSKQSPGRNVLQSTNCKDGVENRNINVPHNSNNYKDRVEDIPERDSFNRLLGTSNNTIVGDSYNRSLGTNKNTPERGSYIKSLGTSNDTLERDAFNRLLGTSNNTIVGDSYNRSLGTSKNTPEWDCYNRSLGNSKNTERIEYTEERPKSVKYESVGSDNAIVKSEESPKYVTNRNMKVIMDLLRKNKQKNCDQENRDKSVCDTRTVIDSLKPTENDKVTVINDGQAANRLPFDDISSFDSHDFTQEWKSEVKSVIDSPSEREEKDENLSFPKSESNPASERDLDKDLDMELKLAQRTKSSSKHHINLPVTIETIEIIDDAREKNCDIQMSDSFAKQDSSENFASSEKDEESNNCKITLDGEEESNNSKITMEEEEESDGCFTLNFSPLSHVTESDSDVDEANIINANQSSSIKVQNEISQIENKSDVHSTTLCEQRIELCTKLDTKANNGPELISISNNEDSDDQLKVDRIKDSCEDIVETNEMIFDDSSKEYSMSTSKSDEMDMDNYKTDDMHNINHNEEVMDISKNEIGQVGKLKNDEITNSSENISEIQKAMCANDEIAIEPELNNSNKTKYTSTQSQDTMEFSCDTMFEDSQNFYLSSTESLNQETTPDNQEKISQSYDKDTVNDCYNTFNKGEGSDAVLHLAENKVERTQPGGNSIRYLQAGVRKEITGSDSSASFTNSRLLQPSNMFADSRQAMSDTPSSGFQSFMMGGVKYAAAFRNNTGPSVPRANIASGFSLSSQDTDFNTDSFSSEDCVVPAASNDDDEDVYDQLYKRRPMYQQETGHECSEALDQKQTEAKTQYRSSLCLYKQQLAESKIFSIQPEAQISDHQNAKSCVVDEQFKNEPSTGREYLDSHFRNDNEYSADGLTGTGIKISSQIYRRDGEYEIDMHKEMDREASKDGISNRAIGERSKWDQYVPEQTEEEIDLINYKRREPVKRDFSVIETHMDKRANIDLLNTEEDIDIMQYKRKEAVNRDFSDVETDMGMRSNIDMLNSKPSYAQRYNRKIDPVQEISNSPFNKTVCDMADSMSSIDSQELMLAADDIEKQMVDIGYVNFGPEQFNKSKVIVELDDKPATVYDKLNSEHDDLTIIGDENNDDCDTKNEVIGLKNSSNNDNFAANPDNDGHLFNDSLDLSLSFEDQTELMCQKNNSGSIQQPVLRVGWKPPSNNMNSIYKITHEKANNDNNGDTVKPTFRCLKLLAKSKLSPNVQCNSPDETTYADATVVNKDNVNSGNAVNVMDHKLYSPKHFKLEHITDKSEAPSLQAKEQRQFRNLGSTSTSVRTNFKSPVLSQQQNEGIEDLQPMSRAQTGKRFKPPGMIQVGTSVKPREFKTGSVTSPSIHNNENVGQKLSGTELCFPGREIVEFTQNVTREVIIPATFASVHQYKQTLTSAVIENLNTMLFDISKRYHQALSRVDTSGYTKSAVGTSSSDVSVLCKCGTAAKILSVRKEGPNKGRQFYGCSKPTQQRCKFFQWADGKVSAFNSGAGNKRKISEPHVLGMYMKDQHVHFYPECQLIRKTKENLPFYFKRPKWVRGKHEEETVVKKQMFVKLPRKGHSSLYAKDDIWVISKDLDFRPSTTFLARSTFYGPLSSNELEIEPLYGYSPSNWSGEVVCHGLLAGNATTELKCLENIKEHVTSQSPRVLPQLLDRETQCVVKSHGSTGFSVPRMVSTSSHTDGVLVRTDIMDDLVRKYIDEYRLNTDQTEALRRVSHMFCLEKADSVDNVLLLHGVFGAGKSFLLSLMVLFLVEVFEMITTDNTSLTWKLLISSTTNVAVDRILQGVLELGFEDFVRVGSVKKIAKPILPYSIHASGTDSQELKDLQEMLRSSDLTPTEKSLVRKSIEKHRQGENKKKLGAVKVVGVTCASSSVASLNNMNFPVVFLDECSQMTEPSSLLPVARFGCQKLLLVGDPKQLDPTIEGAKASHDQGLEQTMFNRLIKMGYIPTILRTQYRCHPWISAIPNQLFYGDILLNGVTEMDRLPLLDVIPTICFYDVDRGQECCEGGGSFYNEREARFVVFLLQVLTASGIESSSIGVITLYRSQMFRINDLIVSCGDNNRLKGIQVSTVDAFQGGERDVIILSCVRTDACGFIDNDKRTNVALTRAKHHLLIVGHYKNLSNNYLWGKVLHHCKGHKDGVQSADEAQQHLGVYLVKLPSETGSVANEMETAVQKPRKSSAKGPKNTNTRKSKTRVTSPSLNDGEKIDIDSHSSSICDITSDHSQTSHYGEGTIDPGNENVVVSRDIDWCEPCDRTNTTM